MDNSNLPHFSYVGDSVLGRWVNIGGGTKVANLRHDSENVKVEVKGKVIDSGRRKLGMFIGDHSKLGISTNVYPGVCMGPMSWTSPNEVVKRNLKPFQMMIEGKSMVLPEKKLGSLSRYLGTDEVKFMKKLYKKIL